MKQVVFAVLLMAMASLTGCLNGDDSPVDENIDTTDDSTSDTTEDNSDTTDDTKDDELIEPVGQTGDTTIPEDSSVFMDSVNIGTVGNYECTNPDGELSDYSDDAEDMTCTYTYFDSDFFENQYNNDGEFNGITYRDADGIGNSIDFNGWVNKTGKQVTIELLYYPDRGYYYGSYQDDIDGDGNSEVVPAYTHNVNMPVGYTCISTGCSITFYGNNGLEYSAYFAYITRIMDSERFAIDYDNDGIKDSFLTKTIYQKHTLNFDLPFEPYGFNLDAGSDNVDRIF